MPFEELRKKIDRIDDRILDLIERRISIAEKIGKAKRKKGRPIVDSSREREILNKLTGKTKLNKDFVRKTFEGIIEYCRENE